MGRLHVYEERTDKYLSCFKQYVDNAKIVVDVGCGTGTFSKALAYGRRLVIALDIQEKLLREIEEENIHKVCADAHHLPFRENSIGCVLSL
jgi:ubiquinone/menaquinone biosynthesis C-methylase UbiE